MASFSHLHVHTEYSLLDGMSQIKDLVAHTKELGMNSVAITDHGAMYGVIEFYRACKAEGIKPIIGMEGYMSPRGMADRDPNHDRNYTHLLLLAENQTGYQNLLKIASVSQLEGYYYKPRIDHDFLATHAEGLICTSGCLAAEIPQMLMEGREKEARRKLGWYQDVFGPEHFYIELQEHDIPELHQVNKALYEIAPYAEVPYLATNDVHYVRREDADPHDVLLCIGTGSLVSDSRRLKFSGDSYYMRSPAEMAEIFGDVPGAIENTLKVAEMCNVNLDADEYHLPEFPIPDGYDAASYLRHLCMEGLKWRYDSRADDPEIVERLNHELGIIHTMGFDTYFLIVWDLCEFARDHDIWWNVRGSGAGSVVAYSLGITNIDPLRNGLIFERFLNPGRVTMPDIDLDYPDDRRAEMIEYCVHKYGEEKVAQIITFGTMGARAAVRDVARALDIPLNEVDQIAKMIPAIPGKSVSIEKALAEIPEFSEAYNDTSRPYIKELIDTAARLEGMARHASTHAAGVLIADKPLVEYTPLNRPTSQGEGLGAVSQWPMEIVESIGLLKVDFLGLRTLTIMRKACELIERYHGIAYDLDSIPYRHIEVDIPEAEEHNGLLDGAFELLQSGNTSGVFQVEGAGMTRMLMEMRPSRFENVIAAISLFRPGPIEYIPTYIRRMHGDEDVAYHHPKLQPILEETYGIIVYQEQIMQIGSLLFGYDMGEADLMRRAVSKKKEKELKKHKSIFMERGPDNEIPAETAEKIFDDIEFFARYGFNKSHAADYAVLTVQTAFLKAHYPHEYMTALLTIERGSTDKVGHYINDSRRMGIDVLPPNINVSGYDFIIEEFSDGRRMIRYGLSAIKNVGDGSVEAILASREDGPFVDIADFCQRTDLRAVGKRALESLIKVGALDDLGERLQLLESLDRLMNFSGSEHKAADVGQMSLFGDTTGVTLEMDASGLLVEEVSIEVAPRELLQWERELVGVYVSEHPLQKISERLRPIISVSSVELTEADHGRQVAMAGMVSSVRKHMTKTGKQMAFAEIEDLYGTVRVVIWPSTWDETQELWEPDRILLIRGKIDAERGEPQLLCEEATTNFEIFESAESPWQPSEPQMSPPSYDEIPPPPEDDDYAYLPPEEVSHSAPTNGQASQANGATTKPSKGNGRSQQQRGGNGRAQQSAPAAPPVPEVELKPMPGQEMEENPVRLRVWLQRSGDQDRDQRRLRHLHGLLIEKKGKDTFSIVLVDDQRSVEIDFPNDTTNYDSVIDNLVEYLGDPASVEILDS